MTKDVVTQYLSRYATEEARWDAWRGVAGTWEHFLAVPLCRERATIAELCAALDQASPGRRVLAMFLVNARKNAAADLLADNEATLAFLKERYGMTPLTEDGLIHGGESGSLTVLLIDRTTQAAWRFHEKEGIGLARKILSDLAVRFHVDGKLVFPWVHHTDGDARPSPDHFDIADTLRAPGVSALSHGFIHLPNPAHPETFSALAAYEIWLRHYALGLAWAGSPYGFPTIGSLISCRLDAYAQARGFPQRMAGEDFYLLNKLAKLGSVRTLMHPTVALLDRPSDRVPFGTGAGVAKLLEKAARGEQPTLYDPRVFARLREFFTRLFQHFQNFSAARWQDAWPHALPVTGDELDKAVREAWQRGRSQGRAWREFHHWFDAFRTLKYVHALRDTEFPNLPLAEALVRSPFLTWQTTPAIHEALVRLRAEPFPSDNWESLTFS